MYIPAVTSHKVWATEIMKNFKNVEVKGTTTDIHSIPSFVLTPMSVTSHKVWATEMMKNIEVKGTITHTHTHTHTHTVVSFIWSVHY